MPKPSSDTKEVVDMMLELEGLQNHADLVNGYWEEFEGRHETQMESHPWKLKYYIALAFAEGVAKGLKHQNGQAEKD